MHFAFAFGIAKKRKQQLVAAGCLLSVSEFAEKKRGAPVELLCHKNWGPHLRRQFDDLMSIHNNSGGEKRSRSGISKTTEEL